MQTDEFWQDVTAPILENMRRKLRDLVRLIDKEGRRILYTDFEDELGGETTFDLPSFAAVADFGKFRAKALHFLKSHEDRPTIHKLRWNEPLTTADIADLERMLVEAGAGSAEDIERAKTEYLGLGIFLRSLVGLDREAAKWAFDGFLAGKTLHASQLTS